MSNILGRDRGGLEQMTDGLEKGRVSAAAAASDLSRDEWARNTTTAPQPKEKLDKAYPFRMTETQHNRLAALAKRDDRSIQYLLSKVVWPAIEELERRG